MNRYIGILCKDGDSAFGIHFPDLPGCTAAGDTEEEALANAAIALRLWAEDVAELPAPSSLEALLQHPEVAAEQSMPCLLFVQPQ
jgi:predicted RNase H-like HicB family nuclease